jgi:hypothetical protein
MVHVLRPTSESIFICTRGLAASTLTERIDKSSEVCMRTHHTLHFDALARNLAVTVGATVRRWWLDPKHAQHFHVEAMRTFVGAKPVVVQFTATLDAARPPQLRGQPQMQVVTETHLPATAPPSANGAAPAVRRPPRPSRRRRAAQPRTRTGARHTSKTRPTTTPMRTPRNAQRRSRPRTRR